MRLNNSMRKIIPLLGIVLFISCDSPNQIFSPMNSGSLNRVITIKFGQTAYIEGSRLAIKFKSVEHESRCPKDVICFTAGTVIVLLEVTQGKIINEVTLSPNEKIMGSRMIQLLEVNPYPNTMKDYISEDYNIKIIVN